VAADETVQLQADTGRGVELFAFLKCPRCRALLDPGDRAAHDRELHSTVVAERSYVDGLIKQLRMDMGRKVGADDLQTALGRLQLRIVST
jgi:hypothetical protein